MSATAAFAVPPPPVPKAWTDASSNISRIAPVLTGDWRAPDRIGKGSTLELRIGRFGNSANPYLLIGRVAHIPQGQSGALGEVQAYDLSVLIYLSPCNGFAMLSLDQLAREGETVSCARAFPIDVRADGTLSFSYTEKDGSRLVNVSVDGTSWRETTSYPARLGINPREVEFRKSGNAVAWGIVR